MTGFPVYVTRRAWDEAVGKLLDPGQAQLLYKFPDGPLDYEYRLIGVVENDGNVRLLKDTYSLLVYEL